MNLMFSTVRLVIDANSIDRIDNVAPQEGEQISPVKHCFYWVFCVLDSFSLDFLIDLEKPKFGPEITRSLISLLHSGPFIKAILG